jgi:mannitol-1-phosphate 5-dehydrogenase
MHESARALQAAYPNDFTAATLSEHIADLLQRFRNRALGDTVFRVGRDLLRKLSREDRVIGAMLFDLAHGVDCPATARVAAAALEFRGTDERDKLSSPDEKFAEDLYPLGLDVIFTRVCGLRLEALVDQQVAATIRTAHATLKSGVIFS